MQNILIIEYSPFRLLTPFYCWQSIGFCTQGKYRSFNILFIPLLSINKNNTGRKSMLHLKVIVVVFVRWENEASKRISLCCIFGWDEVRGARYEGFNHSRPILSSNRSTDSRRTADDRSRGHHNRRICLYCHIRGCRRFHRIHLIRRIQFRHILRHIRRGRQFRRILRIHLSPTLHNWLEKKI